MEPPPSRPLPVFSSFSPSLHREAVGRTDVSREDWQDHGGTHPRAGVRSLALSLESSAGVLVPLKRLDAGDPLRHVRGDHIN